MNDELTARQRAISLRIAGRSVKHICSTLGRGETWFRKWWHPTPITDSLDSSSISWSHNNLGRHLLEV